MHKCTPTSTELIKYVVPTHAIYKTALHTAAESNEGTQEMGHEPRKSSRIDNDNTNKNEARTHRLALYHQQ